MPILTQGKTNWKFLLIVIVLAVIVGGGIWSYLQITEKEFETQPVDIPERVIKDETTDWLTYRNEEYGFEIKYPKALILEESAIIRHPDILGTVIRFPVGYIANSPITNAKIDIWVRDYGACKRHESPEDTYVILKQDFLINNIPFQLGTWSYMPPSVGYEYMTGKNNQCYEITLILRGEDQKAFYDVVKVNNRQPEIFFDIIDKVVTTFRFIEKSNNQYNIFGTSEFDTIVSGYLEIENWEIIEGNELVDAGTKGSTAYFVITKFYDEDFKNSMEEGINEGNTVNTKENSFYKFNLGCFEDEKIKGIEYEKDEKYMDDITMEKIINSSKGKPISIILSFGYHEGFGCICCNLAHKVRIYEE